MNFVSSCHLTRGLGVLFKRGHFPCGVTKLFGASGLQISFVAAELSLTEKCTSTRIATDQNVNLSKITTKPMASAFPFKSCFKISLLASYSLVSPFSFFHRHKIYKNPRPIPSQHLQILILVHINHSVGIYITSSMCLTAFSVVSAVFVANIDRQAEGDRVVPYWIHKLCHTLGRVMCVKMVSWEERHCNIRQLAMVRKWRRTIQD